MKELKCPKCGNAFVVDEADYASILNQVKNAEFQDELNRRISEIHKQQQAEQKADAIKAEQDFQRRINEKELELGKKDTEIAQLREQAKSAVQSKEIEFKDFLADRDAQIAKLKKQLEYIEKAKELEIANEVAKKEQEISSLKSTIAQNDSQRQIAVMEEKNKAQEALLAKDAKIAELENRVTSEKNEATIRENGLKEQHAFELRQKQEEIDFYKDMKARMSTKMIGESLEVHCSTEFNKMRMAMFPNADFDKDNDIKEGTKGDFIFRDYADDMEYISIMFEMKNECDTTTTKHKNEHFFKKLDEDRRKKNCEYAVLVSLLEPDNDLYNQGIVDVSYIYPKMYVVRPQFFMPLISLLTQASKKSLEYRRELELARQQSIDVTNFETKVNAFRDKFGRHYELASRKFKEAIDDIDATIKKLQKIKDELTSSENNLRLANKDTEDLEIRRLTRNNKTMKAKFEEARVINSKLDNEASED